MMRLVFSIPEVPQQPLSNAECERREAALLARYPAMFDPLMHKHGLLELMSGWLPLVEVLCDEVHKLLPPDGRGAFQWVQIKEKFGELRAYYENGPTHVDILGTGQLVLPPESASGGLTAVEAKAIDALVAEAEDLSRQICQRCGARGHRHNFDGLIATLCDACAELVARHRNG